MPVPDQLMFKTWIASLHIMPVMVTPPPSTEQRPSQNSFHCKIQATPGAHATMRLAVSLAQVDLQSEERQRCGMDSRYKNKLQLIPGGHYHESIFLFNLSFITPMIPGSLEGQYIQTRSGKSLPSAYSGRDSKPDFWFIDRSMYHSNYSQDQRIVSARSNVKLWRNC
ncbi:hypothetical protein EDD22DRAFT_1053065, partial [Suillus occidentalis]